MKCPYCGADLNYKDYFGCVDDIWYCPNKVKQGESCDTDSFRGMGTTSPNTKLHIVGVNTGEEGKQYEA